MLSQSSQTQWGMHCVNLFKCSSTAGKTKLWGQKSGMWTPVTGKEHKGTFVMENTVL